MVSIPDRLSEKPRPLRTQSPRFDVGPSTSREAEGGKDVKTKNVKTVTFKVLKPFDRSVRSSRLRREEERAKSKRKTEIEPAVNSSSWFVLVR